MPARPSRKSFFKIRPIRTAKDHTTALAAIEKLWGAKAGTPDGDTLDVLLTLVHAYEEKHVEIPPPDPIEAVLFRMEQKGLERRDLQKILNTSAGRVSEVLNRRRALSVAMIRRLHEALEIPAEVLIQPTM